MPKLPVLKPKAMVKFLQQNGFQPLRQIGSHLHLYHQEFKLRVTVPMHNKDLKRKTLISIFRQAKIKYN
ncbi:MAG: type II toxin-antitoxin system HicA family toxin [Patescibacteria group bacterium]